MCSVMAEAASFTEINMGLISIKPIWPIKHWPDFYFFPQDTRKIPARYHGDTERKNRKTRNHLFPFSKCPAFAEEKFPCSKLPSNYTTKIGLLLYNLPAQVSDAWQLQRKPR
jgi:hypothetical protein